MARPKSSPISIRGIRNTSYKLSKLLGDVSALQRGDVGGRITRRIAGKATGRGLRIFN
jgi:hypothetical protein